MPQLFLLASQETLYAHGFQECIYGGFVDYCELSLPSAAQATSIGRVNPVFIQRHVERGIVNSHHWIGSEVDYSIDLGSHGIADGLVGLRSSGVVQCIVGRVSRILLWKDRPNSHTCARRLDVGDIAEQLDQKILSRGKARQVVCADEDRHDLRLGIDNNGFARDKVVDS